MKPVLVLRKENWKMKERIAVLRKTLGLTQKQFGEQIGVQRGTIANYELGRNIPTETVRLMICGVYDRRRGNL